MGERLRPVDPVHVEVLGRAIMREGQATPIVVCRLPGRNDWTLVAGAHRVEAARKFDIEQLKAEIISPDKIGRRQREISENLWRKDLDPIDRANFIAELVRLAKLRAGIDPDASAQQIAANARWQKAVKTRANDACATIAHVYGWVNDVAEDAGFSRRTVYNDLTLHTRLSPAAIEKLRKVRPDIARNAKQLRDLAKYDHEWQRDIVHTLQHGNQQLGGRRPKSIAEAAACLSPNKKPVQDAETKRLSAFLGAFGRMSLAEKKGALEHLSGQAPSGFRVGKVSVDEKVMQVRMEDARGALQTAFKVLVQLVDGEPVDDEQLQDACAEVQHALMGLNDIKGAEA